MKSNVINSISNFCMFNNNQTLLMGILINVLKRYLNVIKMVISNVYIKYICNFYFVFYDLSSVADNKSFHTAGTEHDQPYLYCILTQPGDKVRKKLN